MTLASWAISSRSSLSWIRPRETTSRSSSAHHLVDGVAADAVVGLDDLGNLLARREDGLDLQAREQPNLVEGVQVKRVVRRDADRAVVAVDGYHAVAVDELRRRLAKQLAVEPYFAQIDERDRKLFGVDVEVIAVVDVSEPYQAVLDPFGGLAQWRPPSAAPM